MSDYNRFKFAKLDQTPYLFHFTKGSLAQARANFQNILKEKKLVSKENKYICFTASPVTQLGSFFDTHVYGTNRPMYQPYGIGIPRDVLIREFGAKNVIYGDRSDFENLQKVDMDWRFESLSVKDPYNIRDYEWLREWRVPCKDKELDFSTIIDDVIIIVPTQYELEDFAIEEEVRYQASVNPFTGDVEPEQFEYYNRLWKAYSWEKIKMNVFANDYALKQDADGKEIGEDMFDEVTEILKQRFEECMKNFKDAGYPMPD